MSDSARTTLTCTGTIQEVVLIFTSYLSRPFAPSLVPPDDGPRDVFVPVSLSTDILGTRNSPFEYLGTFYTDVTFTVEHLCL